MARLTLLLAGVLFAVPATGEKKSFVGEWNGVGCRLTLQADRRYAGRCDEGTAYRGTWRDDGAVLVLRGPRGAEVRYRYETPSQGPQLVNDRGHVVFARRPLTGCMMCDPPQL